MKNAKAEKKNKKTLYRKKNKKTEREGNSVKNDEGQLGEKV